jgi:hypothetical protein
MASDLTLNMQNRPGELARVGEALGGAGENITGFCATTAGAAGEVHVMEEDYRAERGLASGLDDMGKARGAL